MTGRLPTCRLWICSAAVAVLMGLAVYSPVAAADPPPGARAEHVADGLCLLCHGQPGITTEVDGQERAVAPVDQVQFAASAHGEKACVDCHLNQTSLPHRAATLTQPVQRATACQACHEEAYEGYLESPHGTMADLEYGGGPACADCHGSAHTVQPIRDWNKEERAQVCAGCHPGAGTGFLKALSHEAPSPGFLPSVYFAEHFLVLLASASLAFGIIHVELDLLRWLVQRRRSRTAGRRRWEST